MSTYQSTSSEADEAKLKPSNAASSTTNKKRPRSASHSGQSSQDEQLTSTNKKSTTASSSSAQATAGTTTEANGAAATPAVNLRKEQNRAAQRAFRDRKERHLQQLENLIQDLKDQQFLLTTRFQREIQQLKAQNQVVVQENQYLREVVFAFESALNYRGDMEVLQDVKQGLYRRYVGKQQHQNGSGITVIEGGAPQEQEREQQQGRQPPPLLPTVLASPSPSLASTRASSSPALQTTTTTTSTTASAIPTIQSENDYNSPNLLSPAGWEAVGTGDFISGGDANTSVHSVQSTSPLPLQQISNPADTTTPATETDTTSTPYSINREILYRVPASLHISELKGAGDDVSQATVGGGLLAAATTSSSGGGVVPLSPFFPAGTPLPKVTDYTKHPTVFDELQSSLFPPGTLQSVVSTNMASPLDVVNDTKLFDQLGDKSEDSGAASSTTRNKTTTTTTTTTTTAKISTMSTMSNGHTASSMSHSVSAATGLSSAQSTPTKSPLIPAASWTRTELLQKTHRLQKTFEVLAAGPLRSDPKIDQQIYQIPHDSRIDLVPCPKLRAQMILHQHKYNIDEVFELLIDKAICHGHPLEPSDWELPEEFFERYGFLIGVDLEHQRRKVWPRPLPPDMM
ncbi:hypothetical protein EC991_004488 [Linnemannia zychae]|nr:hypothetical protein EC991_004488 [Linnemannia zychae]